MTLFPLVVLTPREVVFEGDISSLVLPTADGEIGFLAGREDAVLELLPGDIRLTTPVETVVLETDGGVAEMSAGTLTVLCGAAYRKEEAEFKKQQRETELSERKKQQEQSLAEYKLTRAALIRAFDKLKRSKLK